MKHETKKTESSEKPPIGTFQINYKLIGMPRLKSLRNKFAEAVSNNQWRNWTEKAFMNLLSDVKGND